MTSKKKRAQGRKLAVALRREVKLIQYDRACKAIAAAKRVDEVKRIRDVAVAMKAYARQANNHELEADAIEIRMRATRRMDQMRQEQAKTIGLAKGGGGKHGRKRVAEKPTLKEAGINKNLAHEGRKLGALSDQEFEQKVAEARISLAEYAERANRPGAARKRIHITDTPTPPGRPRPVTHITAPPEHPTELPPWTNESLHRAAAERFPQWLREVAFQIAGFGAAADTAALLPAMHMKVDEDAEMIRRFLDEFRRARRDRRPDLNGGGDGEGADRG